MTESGYPTAEAFIAAVSQTEPGWQASGMIASPRRSGELYSLTLGTVLAVFAPLLGGCPAPIGSCADVPPGRSPHDIAVDIANDYGEPLNQYGASIQQPNGLPLSETVPANELPSTTAYELRKACLTVVLADQPASQQFPL